MPNANKGEVCALIEPRGKQNNGRELQGSKGISDTSGVADKNRGRETLPLRGESWILRK